MSALDYNANAYLAVTLSSSSPFVSNPASLASVHRDISVVGQVGQLDDVQLVSIPKASWDSSKETILSALTQADGVVRVEPQVLKQRVKRSGDEL